MFAHLEAEVVAHNIAAKIKGAPASSEFDGRGYCFVELGDGRAGFAKGNFYAEPAPAVSLYRPGGTGTSARYYLKSGGSGSGFNLAGGIP